MQPACRAAAERSSRSSAVRPGIMGSCRRDPSLLASSLAYQTWPAAAGFRAGAGAVQLARDAAAPAAAGATLMPLRNPGE
jgi:hypothetical protein